MKVEPEEMRPATATSDDQHLKHAVMLKELKKHTSSIQRKPEESVTRTSLEEGAVAEAQQLDSESLSIKCLIANL